MSGRVIAAIAHRVLHQLRRDPRTIVLILGMPPLLLTILRSVFDGRPELFANVAVGLVGFFPLLLMFIITSITMLRERTSGTLERLMSLPVAKADLLLGYAAAFGLVAAVQATVTATVTIGPLGVEIDGAAWLLVLFAVVNALLGVALGLFASAFARSEFQAVQMMPALILPQLLLCGLLAPRDQMGELLQAISVALPMTWAFDGLARVADGEGLGTSAVTRDLIVVLAVALAALAAGAATLRRRTP
ncbi:MAG: putative transporter permease protein [Thermoleophilia bacterium]|nr:putative transporter permease protein [Thermoleophilia bacterium]